MRDVGRENGKRSDELRVDDDRRLAADFFLLALSVAVLIGPTGVQLSRDGPTVEREHALVPLTLEINTAPWYEWTLLEGIGAKCAQRIVEYRAAHGLFRSIDDLNAIRGLPKGWVKRAAPLLSVEWRHHR